MTATQFHQRRADDESMFEALQRAHRAKRQADTRWGSDGGLVQIIIGPGNHRRHAQHLGGSGGAAAGAALETARIP